MNRRHFIATLSAMTLLGCGNRERAFHHTDLSEGKVFPTGNLLDGSGRPRNFDEFRGKVVLVYFGYTSCPDLCPGALRKYASLIRNMRTRDAERVQLIFISVDPERDTPERTDTYVKWFNPAFLGLSGSLEQIADVAKQFKVIYSKKTLDSGMGYVIDHSTNGYLIDPQGQLRVVFPENALLEPMMGDIQLLLDGK
ncbi:MAG: SCO family protein [Azonexus sp.]|jgi:protein SCO1/2|nr:SCO family protein [Azonexus sp.]